MKAPTNRVTDNMPNELRDLIDVGHLQDGIDQRIPGRGELVEVTRLHGGSSNLMFKLERAGRAYVLRRPPRERYDPTSHNIKREVTLFTALAKTDIPHPRLATYCEDADVIGAPFVVMEFVDGFSPVGVFPEPMESDLSLRRAIGFGMVDALAKLAILDWRGVGLEQFGKPVGFLERQVDRWMGQLGRYRTRDIPHLDALAQWLRDKRPAQAATSLMHGDYSFPNVMFARQPPVQMAAIVDWESATIGDPLLDLGHLLAGWCDPGETRTYHKNVDWKAMPTRQELAARYAELTGLPIENINYYRALALFKLAIILEGAYARFKNGQSDYEGHRTLDVRVPAFIEQAYSFTQAA
jgi:aminoglycoside phosphotransferase (APT) family kinase protein